MPEYLQYTDKGADLASKKGKVGQCTDIGIFCPRNYRMRVSQIHTTMLSFGFFHASVIRSNTTPEGPRDLTLLPHVNARISHAPFTLGLNQKLSPAIAPSAITSLRKHKH